MDEFGSNYVWITDEGGNNYELEHLFNFEYEDSEIAVFLPAQHEGEPEDLGIIMFRVFEERGEEVYENIPEDMLEGVNDRFMEILYETE